MKRAIFIFFITVLLVTGCGRRNDNIRFTATVDSVGENSIMITPIDKVDFDKAIVGFSDGLELTFNLLEGQTVAIEALPLIRESYPVQITAVKITLKEETGKVEYKRITPKEAMEIMGEDLVILDWPGEIVK
ncbi:MAG: hypothetical protein GX352_07965 [Clostridiales bacterium]|nr:hypothetical protein [Clostridiales bacterium]